LHEYQYASHNRAYRKPKVNIGKNYNTGYTGVMGAWPPRFLFITGWLSLDFALTGGKGARAKWERIGTTNDLRDWFAACSLQLRVARVRKNELVMAHDLREAVWNGAQSVLHKIALPENDLAIINATAKHVDLVPRLMDNAHTWDRGQTATQALSTIARNAITFFGSEHRMKLRECANPHCPLIFVDESRPGKRMWCAMRRCGNMEKTKRYRQNIKRNQ